MSKSTGTQRILARLKQGPASHKELYGTCYAIIHSRAAELRKRGYDIRCERSGDTWTYSLGGSLPSAVTPNPLAPEVNGFTLSGEEYAPRDERNRFRLYRLAAGQLDLLATVETAEAIGPALVTLQAEGEYQNASVGVLDCAPEYEEGTGTWIVLPWGEGRNRR